MKKILIAFVSLILVFGSSCHTQRIMLKDAKVDGTTPTFEKSQTFFFYGVIGNPQTINLNEACHGKTPVAIETQTTLIDGLISYIIGIVYSPATVKVYCQ
jgi:hypothetical protein